MFFVFLVKINGSYDDQMLMGLMLVVVPKGAKDEKLTLGAPKVRLYSYEGL